MIHINGKKLFIIGFDVSVDSNGVASCKLVSIKPRPKADTTPGSDYTIINDICNALTFQYMKNGYPYSVASPVNPKTFNRDFGIKLAKKKMFRKVFRDIDRIVTKEIESHKHYVDQLMRLNAYMCGISSRTEYSIHKMNVVAAKLEAEVEGKPFRPESLVFEPKTGETLYKPGITTEITDETIIHGVIHNGNRT